LEENEMGKEIIYSGMIGAALLASPRAFGDFESDGGSEDYLEEGQEETFQEDCHNLMALERESLLALTSLSNAKNFDTFCTPGLSHDCAYYNILFFRYGALINSPDDFFCRFIPRIWLERPSQEDRSLG
jgi:hypothetical protein